jgi:hypothetical protein
VNTDGSIIVMGRPVGYGVEYYNGGVRPALWINLMPQAESKGIRKSTTQRWLNKENVRKGEIVGFGGYEWYILDVQDDKALLLSKIVIEERRYDLFSKGDLTWEKCTLREYLNKDFYDLLGEDKLRILESTLINNCNFQYGIDGGNNTNDHIFLLSLEDVQRYFDSKGLLKGMDGDGTNNESLLTVVDELEQKHCWWLRTPGENSNDAMYVDLKGNVCKEGTVSYKWAGGVRPAMWIKLDTIFDW